MFRCYFFLITFSFRRPTMGINVDGVPWFYVPSSSLSSHAVTSASMGLAAFSSTVRLSLSSSLVCYVLGVAVPWHLPACCAPPRLTLGRAPSAALESVLFFLLTWDVLDPEGLLWLMPGLWRVKGSGSGVNMKEDETAVGGGITNTILIPIIDLLKLNTAVAKLRPGLLAECGISVSPMTLFILV